MEHADPRPGGTRAPLDITVGGYTDPGRASGVSLLSWPSDAGDDDTDHRVVLDVQGVLPADNPSFLIAHPSEPWFYAVCETDHSRLVWLAPDRAGRLVVRESVATGGANACHLALDPSGQWLVVAHYGDGAVTSHTVAADGRPSPVVDRFDCTGEGPHERQDGPHAHQVVAHGGELLVSNLGGDRIHRLLLDGEGRLTPVAEPIVTPDGFGPRHLQVIGGNRLVVVGELAAEVALLVHEGGHWQTTARISTTTSTDECLPSAIVLDGDRAIVANRGPDTFAVVEIDGEGLELVTEVPTGGVWPRDLVLHEGRVWVANERSHSVTVFREIMADPERDWALDFSFGAPSPTCVVLTRP